MAQIQFDANQVKPQDAFEPLPAGWYNARIIGSEVKPTKDQQSAYLQLDIEIIDGAYANRKVFDRLNLWNNNPTAAEIAQRRLSAYCHATGVIVVQDSQQLHGIPFKAKISVREDKTGQYEPSNEVKLVKHINEQVGGGAPAQGFSPAPQGFTPPAAPAAPQTATFTQQPTAWQGRAPVPPTPPTPPTPPAPPAAPPQMQPPQMAPPQLPPPAPAPTGPVPPWAKR